MNISFFPFSKTKKQVFLFAFAGIMLLMILCSCSARKTYFGQSLEKDQVAIIKPFKKVFTDVDIKSLDGYRLGYFDSCYEVLPGSHTMDVHVRMDYPCLHDDLEFIVRLSFDAEPGHTYGVYGTILPFLDKGYVRVESDQAPGETVTAKHVESLRLVKTSNL